MTRVFENKGYWWRQTLSAVAVVLVAIYGGWELWSAMNAEPGYRSPFGEMLGIGDDRTLFGVIFLGGGIIAMWQLYNDSKDVVSTFDVDDATGETKTTLWTPYGTQTLTAPLAAIKDWRFHVALGSRNMRTYYIYADHPAHPRPLRFDLRRADLEGLRRFTPEGIAEYERLTTPPPKA